MFASLFYPVLAVATSSAAAAIAYVWYVRPSIAVRCLIRMGMFKAGLKVHYVYVGGKSFCYAERGVARTDQSTIVFVHGFSASKDSWVSIIQRLPKDLHVVAVDLIGHGDSSLSAPDEVPSTTYLAEALHEMLTATGLTARPIHLIGTSMGGAISSIYTTKYPSDVDILTVICPAVHTPVMSVAHTEIRKGGKNYLLPRSVEDMELLLNLVVYHKERIPHNKQILSGFVQMKEPNMEFYTALFNSMLIRNEADSRQMLVQVHKPVQVIWGDSDESLSLLFCTTKGEIYSQTYHTPYRQLVHVSGAEYLRGVLPDCRRVDIIPECGHATGWDSPDRVAALLLEFRQETSKKTH